jgi:hypothetical protein
MSRGLLDEAEYAATGVGRHHPERGRIVNRGEDDGRFSLSVAMEFEHLTKIDVTEDVSIECEEGLVTNQTLCVLEGPGGAERLALVSNLNAQVSRRRVANNTCELIG